MATRKHLLALLLPLLWGPWIDGLQPVAAWWDNGHMLVAAVAQQFLEPEDVKLLNSVLDGHLTGPTDAFADLISAAVWADHIKCTSTAPYCPLLTLPSLPIFDNWHYMSKCVPVNGYPRSADPCPQQDRLDRGIADDMLLSLLKTFSTTHSPTSASFALRMLLHIVGDVHQPLHAADGVDANHPSGDVGGNARRFQSDCNSTNLHALWDSGGGRFLLLSPSFR